MLLAESTSLSSSLCHRRPRLPPVVVVLAPACRPSVGRLVGSWLLLCVWVLGAPPVLAGWSGRAGGFWGWCLVSGRWGRGARAGLAACVGLRVAPRGAPGLPGVPFVCLYLLTPGVWVMHVSPCILFFSLCARPYAPRSARAEGVARRGRAPSIPPAGPLVGVGHLHLQVPAGVKVCVCVCVCVCIVPHPRSHAFFVYLSSGWRQPL